MNCGFTLLSVAKASPSKFLTPVLSPPAAKQIAIIGVRAINRSGGAADVALVKKLADSTSGYSFGTLTAASTPDYVDKTAAIQAGGTINIFDLTNNDGYLVGAPVPFNVFSFVVTQGESGSPVYSYEYFNGSSYTTLTTLLGPTAYTATTITVSFLAPIDWVPGTTAAVGGFGSNYNIRVLATTAPGTIVQANVIAVGQFLQFQPSLADKTATQWSAVSADAPLLLSASEGVAGYFSVSNAGNSVEVQYSVV